MKKKSWLGIGGLVLTLILFLNALPVQAESKSVLYESSGSLQPVALILHDDNTYELFGGEKQIHYAGRLVRETVDCIKMINLYNAFSDDRVLTMITDGDSYLVDAYTRTWDDIDDLVGVRFSIVPEFTEEDLASDYRLAKSMHRRLELSGGMFALWRAPVFSFLPSGNYTIEGHELVFKDMSQWPLMRLLILSDGFVVPDIPASAANFFMLQPGQVYLPETKAAPLNATYTSGNDIVLTLEGDASDREALYTLEASGEVIYQGVFYAYGDRLFLCDEAVSYDGLEPAILFEFWRDGDTLMPLQSPLYGESAQDYEWARYRFK